MEKKRVDGETFDEKSEERETKGEEIQLDVNFIQIKCNSKRVEIIITVVILSQNF